VGDLLLSENRCVKRYIQPNDDPVHDRLFINHYFFVPQTHSTSCTCPSCISFHNSNCLCSGCSKSHPANCACFSCSGGFALRMSDTATEDIPAEVEATATEDVPAEVEALDGIASDEEAHNVERPARGSGIHKHKDDDRKKRTALSDLEIGSTVEATVKTITAYGAFLDIGAKSDALLHVSRLSDDFISNVEDVVKQGDKVSVRIISVDTDKNQVAVTMRSEEAEARAAQGGGGARPSKRRERPQRSGGDQAAQAATLAQLAEKGFDENKFIEGEVVSSLAFGAFVRFDTAQLENGVEGEIDGLVHISALAEGRVSDVASVVSIGDKVQVRIREVDPDGGRISLSMITKEQEEASPPPRREKRGGGKGKETTVDVIGRSWKDTGAADWKETMEAFNADQPKFTNSVVVIEKR
jgi:transcriptional accessory protein Tex/SPT6